MPPSSFKLKNSFSLLSSFFAIVFSRSSLFSTPFFSFVTNFKSLLKFFVFAFLNSWKDFLHFFERRIWIRFDERGYKFSLECTFLVSIIFQYWVRKRSHRYAAIFPVLFPILSLAVFRAVENQLAPRAMLGTGFRTGIADAHPREQLRP